MDAFLRVARTWASAEMIAALIHALSARQRRSCRIFIAWSQETKAAADAIRDHLRSIGFSTWLSEDIKGGRRFRDEISNQIRRADLVVAVFPASPSHWIVAEAGLAYFEQKLIPVVIDSDFSTDPFHDLQVVKLSLAELFAHPSKAMKPLVHTIEDRLGSSGQSLGPYLFRLFNYLFLSGIPIVGLTLVGSLIWMSLTEIDDLYNSLQLWKAAHIVLGATMYGGSVFVALLFARSGISRSFMERQFGIVTAQQLFAIWISVALSQMFVGFYLVYLSDAYMITQEWVVISVIVYFFALIFFLFGFIFYRSGNNADKEGRDRVILERAVFAANTCFGMGLLSLTVVIILMSLKDQARYLLI